MNEKLKEYCRELKEKINLNNKVLFVNFPQFSLDNFEREVAKKKGYYAYQPTGLQYLASSLDKRGLEIDILDLNYEVLKKVNSDEFFSSSSWMDIFKAHLEKKDYSTIGLSNLFVIDFPYFSQAAGFLRENYEKLVISGGQNATYNTGRLLKENLSDFVLQRESENKINFLFDNLYEDLKNKATPGILFKYKGKIEESEGEKDVVELKGNLVKAHGLVPLEEYCKIGSLSPYSRMAGKNIPFAGILLNRGCRANCRFCDVRDYTGRENRSRKTKDFLDEIEYLNKKRGIKFFEFLDDDFTRDKKNASEALEGILQRDVRIKWASTNGLIASTLDEELMEKMEKSGCIGFRIGIESGNPEILKKIRKPGNTGSFLRFSELAKKFPNMFIVDNYIIGLPEENFKQIKDSFYFSFEMNLDWSSYAIYQQNASLFQDKRDIDKIKDFIPAKSFEKSKIKSIETKLEGLEIFNIPDNNVLSYEQLTEVWFIFTLLRDYIGNKNLKPDGRVDKFISWTTALEDRYPTHPYINFYLSLANRLTGNGSEAKAQQEKMIENLGDEYWKKRFGLFKMNEVADSFPKSQKQARNALEFLRKENRIDLII